MLYVAHVDENTILLIPATCTALSNVIVPETLSS
jgi:hypothetical protein